MLEFLRRTHNRPIRRLVVGPRTNGIMADPGIQHRRLLGGLQQTLMLVLAAKVHVHARPVRQIAHGGKRAVQLHARTALGAHRALRD